jgi:hypothetical protein
MALNRHSPYEPRSGVHTLGFPASYKTDARCGRMPPHRQPGRQSRGLIWPFFRQLDTLLPSVDLERMTIGRLMRALAVAAVPR